jgi:DNA (cytosine-5)-methyltransferase 1
VQKLKDKSQLTVVDLFAGAGGFSFAALNVGFDVRAAVELNKAACQSYLCNIVGKHPSLQLYEKNIRHLTPQQLLDDCFSDSRGCDVLLGGPPCQGFSSHRINDAGVDDPRNNLVLRYFTFVRALRPQVFLMENVPGMLWPRHKDYVETLYERGEAAGYYMYPPVTLDARDYGVPQRRQRVFILGVKKRLKSKIVWPPAPTHGNAKSIGADATLKPWRTAQEDVFGIPFPTDDPNNIHMNHTQKLIEVFKSTPLNGGSRKDSNRVLKCHQDYNGHNDCYGRINPDEPGPTMTTACINPSKGRFVHPTEHHGITVRQAARFQTFPDDFIFMGGLTASGAQIGNAVPVKLGEALLRSIQKGLIDNE